MNIIDIGTTIINRDYFCPLRNNKQQPIPDKNCCSNFCAPLSVSPIAYSGPIQESQAAMSDIIKESKPECCNSILTIAINPS